ncbi:MFS general substrate transporter [Mycena metata]|uniref:MFS general substrate transporter n=1 Tax=Mycena metata TaxID=1033252 RepID=A0AAD7NSX9_9AGAR|nr:MFS general substrate transporter [Mycena metata]
MQVAAPPSGQSTQPTSETSSRLTYAEKGEVLDVIYVDFQLGDMQNPASWTPQRKWMVTVVACYFTTLTGATASAYAMGFPSMMRELGCSQEQAALGISMFCLGFALVPLLTSAFSEEFGRRPLYVVCTIGFTAMYIVQAKATNIQTVIAARFLSGAFGSTGSTMVGGTVADIWEPARRGLPMSIYSLCAIAGTGIGPVVAGWVELSLGWRWIEWFHAIAAGVCVVLTYTICKETRTGIMLTRKAKKLRAETGDPRYRAKAEDERGSMRRLLWVSSTRPIILLLTEPTVMSFSLWIGFAWGILYSMFESVLPIFKNLYGFNQGQAGLTFIGMTVGAILGFATNFYQESLYRKHFPSRGPEARLYAACAAAIMFPTGMFIYAWCSQVEIHWIVPIIGITLFMWATFIMYLAVFTYLADCYGTYASSALAGQSLMRNLMGTAFPLFTGPMYAQLGYHWASGLFGFIAVAMIPIPYVLMFFGPKLRARSRFARTVVH